MGTYFWATWLADALRRDKFVADRMIEVPGWQTRGRPPSSFNFLPTGILDHHTACMVRMGHDPQGDLNTIINGVNDVPGPISQLLGTWTPPGVKYNGLNVSPRILVVAAGRANHAGVGTYPWGAPSGNGSVIGIEWCGPSESVPWPDEVIELRERVDACLLIHNGWGIHQLTTHWEYADPEGRKIDPSGPWVGEPEINWNRHWNPDIWRHRVGVRMLAPPHVAAPPKPEGPRPLPLPEIINLEDPTMKVYNPSHRAYDSRAIASPFRASETRVISLAVPSTTKAAIVNITAAGANAAGFVSAWGAGLRPDTSVLNFQQGEAVANAVMVPVSNGTIALWASAQTHLIVDVQATWD